MSMSRSGAAGGAVVVGRSPEAVVRTVPCLYTICVRAQRQRRRRRWRQPRGTQCSRPDDAGLWIEMLHENLWRLLLDHAGAWLCLGAGGVHRLACDAA